MPRISMLTPEEMTDEQGRVAKDIAAGPRGGVRGPFQAWLRSPELADRAQKLGAFVRFETSFEPRLSELAILITARHWRADYEWYAHAPIALKAGLGDGVIEAIRTGGRPDFENHDEAVVYSFLTEVYRTNRAGDETYGAVVEAFGERGVAELVGIAGYYGLVAMTLNVFDMALPEGEPSPFG